MDLKTENRIAAILLKEAAEVRRQAEERGVHAYLCKPNVRGRPNSRFLTATVIGVQQANRAVEVNEMWLVRKKELELDDRIRGRFNEDGCSIRHLGSMRENRSRSKRYAATETKAKDSCATRKRVIQDCSCTEEEGLRDDEIEAFLHSRVKRGRGAVGSRMDETGPYFPNCPDSDEKQYQRLDAREELEHRVVLGPEKPSSLWPCESCEEESLQYSRKKEKKSGSSKKHSKKHRSREEKKYKNKLKRKEKKSKHQ